MVLIWLKHICVLLISCNIIQARIVPKESHNSIRDDEKTPFTLDEFFDRTFSASSWNGTWLTDTTFLYKNSEGNFYKFDVTTKESEIFLDGLLLAGYPDATTTLSPDNQYLLLKYNVSAVFRHSVTAVYTIYNLTTGDFYHINDKIAVQLATFDTTGHGFAYVYENNIYYLADFLDTSSPVKVTTDGVAEVIYNGVPDWVYEEEVFGTGSALWFSPDGKYLAYVKFDDTNVTEFSYFIYGEPGDLADQYPTMARIKYPKVGTPNPLVSTHLYNIDTHTTLEFTLPTSIKNSEEEGNDYVLYDLTWISNSEVVMISTNRIQNESIIITCSLDGSCKEQVSYTQENGWLEPAIPKYNNEGTRRLEILPQPHGDDYFFHLVLSEVSTNTPKRLTYGNRVVTSIYGWDQTNNLVYYAGSVNNTPSRQHIYVVNTETTEDTCLTCDFIVDGENCKYAGASFSKNFNYYVKACNGPNPAYTVIQNLRDESDTFIWNNNTAVREALSKKLRPVISDLQVPISDNFVARVRMLLPPTLDYSQKYPAIVNVYAGPDSNQINDAFSSGVLNYFVTNRSYIYILIDGRGSGRDGLNKMFQVYRRLGTVEIEDQIAVTKFLQESYPFIDRDNTGIWGWSYGGFASTWALVKDTENIFKFALSVAPVTSFIYYDTIYTERYMGLPTEEDNLLGYNNTDITRRVESIRGKLYFVIHGTGDDNVHYQQTLLLIKALEVADISFRQQSYPDENHGIGGLSKHLYHTIDNYWARAFELQGPPLKTW